MNQSLSRYLLNVLSSETLVLRGAPAVQPSPTPVYVPPRRGGIGGSRRRRRPVVYASYREVADWEEDMCDRTEELEAQKRAAAQKRAEAAIPVPVTVSRTHLGDSPPSLHGLRPPAARLTSFAPPLPSASPLVGSAVVGLTAGLAARVVAGLAFGPAVALGATAAVLWAYRGEAPSQFGAL